MPPDNNTMTSGKCMLRVNLIAHAVRIPVTRLSHSNSFILHFHTCMSVRILSLSCQVIVLICRYIRCFCRYYFETYAIPWGKKTIRNSRFLINNWTNIVIKKNARFKYFYNKKRPLFSEFFKILTFIFTTIHKNVFQLVYKNFC